jgi:ornithine cyclodeaminase/alanine dehydrogenase-like protein (mu-crystallin family)
MMTDNAQRPLFLTEADAVSLVKIEDAIAALERAFVGWADATTANLPRQRAPVGNRFFNLMGAAWGPGEVFGLKAYVDPTYHVALYSMRDQRLLALIEANHISQMRTGAASGLATRVLANPDAGILGVIGSGKQAFAQVAAVCAVRPIGTVRVFSRSPERREAFARKVEAELGIEAQPCSSGEACVRDAHVVVTITKSAEPVCRSEWLADGVHVNAAGANSANRRELDEATVLRAAVLVTDDRNQAHAEAAEFIDLAAKGRLDWSSVQELGDITTGRAAGRRSPVDVTVFKSLGIALEDIAFAQLVYRRALETGTGRPL